MMHRHLRDGRPSSFEADGGSITTHHMVRAWSPHKNELDAGFSFPDRRHFFYSEVYPGVRVPSALDFLSFITPSSQKCIKECVVLPAI